MTASTPPLVDVIAEVLAGHRASFLTLRPDETFLYECTCSYTETRHAGETPAAPSLAEWQAAHQARAVLDALERAGGVQFGVKGEGRVKEYGRDRRSAQLDAKRRRAKLVSRVTTAWERAK